VIRRGIIRGGVTREGVCGVMQGRGRVEGGIKGRAARIIGRARGGRGGRGGRARIQGLILHLLIVLRLSCTRIAEDCLVVGT
jgi:hypothetical protein